MNNISLIGMAGCGKSTVGSAISEKFNLSYIDTDHLIEKKFQMTLEDIKKRFGYKFVRLAEEGIILNLNNNSHIISTGGSAIYSDKSMKYLSSFTEVIYISVPLEVIKKRIGSGQERGLAAPIGTPIEDVYLERMPLYEKWAQITLDGTLPIDELVNLIALRVLGDEN